MLRERASRENLTSQAVLWLVDSCRYPETQVSGPSHRAALVAGGSDRDRCLAGIEKSPREAAPVCIHSVESILSGGWGSHKKPECNIVGARRHEHGSSLSRSHPSDAEIVVVRGKPRATESGSLGLTNSNLRGRCRETRTSTTLSARFATSKL